MQTVPVHQAKDRFSALLQAVEEGEEIVITRHGKKIARIVRETEAPPDEAERERIRREAIAELEAFRAKVKPAVPGYSDWKTLRDLGRKY
ncbi:MULTISPECIES: type II toxin-antitoxin system prevent-host-death family antitoxin [Ramlibacter]|uniref:Antitoxin n=1 Tax=Ramlibacter aquaticus TaxID=2780094 RepID=A0ABR9SG89_9BURK|nr:MULTISPECIES: type II toxin-antitoxin system prevent-host-death family antitoxin [Ramlibacter]MBE7941204.1 type II toxin-antitoxin system prevent-host-death family antitoxin [Ramlibacter aquaticus]